MELRTACNRDCPDACGIIATVEDGRVTRIQGDPDHPVTRGFLCRRTNGYLERHEDPSRLTTPLIRRDGELQPASWDEAMDLIASTMLRIRDESGPAALLHQRGGGSLGLLKALGDWLFECFGPCTVKVGDVCSGAGDWAQETDFGIEDSNDLFDLLESRHIILWGKNPHVSNVHLLPVLLQAKAAGTRLLLIDPVRTRTVDMADRYVQPRPGGDLALALGAARLLFEGGHVSSQSAAGCDHVDELKADAFSRSVEEWAVLADASVDDIAAIAGALADGPCAIQVGWGMQRRAKGAEIVRLLDALSALSGNLGRRGGGVSFYFKRRGAFDLSFIKGAAVAPRTILEPLLGPQLLEMSNPPIRFVWITAANPVVTLPGSAQVKRALETREMTVVVDSFLTDTARCAHVVLPTTTMLEDEDLVGAYGHHYLSEVRAVATPLPGVKSDLEILQMLASRIGLSDALAGSADDWKRRLLAGVADSGASLEDLRRGPVKNPRAARVLFEGGVVATPSGRVNLVHGVDAEPPRATAERPLLLMAQATDRAQSSQWQAKDQQGPALATLHPDCASGFADGDLARVESEEGSLVVRLRFDPRQRRDVLLMDKGGWLSAGRAANALVPARASNNGGCAVYLETPVRLLRA